MKKRLVILGAGESGVGAAILGKAKGYDVFVSDFGKIKDQYSNELNDNEIEFEEGRHTESLLLNADIVVKSPGISDKVSIVQKLIEKEIEIISEIEFAGRFTNAKMICITGSNGKTTTTILIYEIFKRAGFNVGLAGNIGFSLARQVAVNNFDYYVIELSSFQLDNMYQFKANIGVLLNITPDHLDRYNYQMQNYVDSKFRLLQNQDEEDHFIYFEDDPIIKAELEKHDVAVTKIPFSIGADSMCVARIEDKNLKIELNQTSFEMPVDELSLSGKHNSANSLAAAVVGLVAGIRKEFIKECLSDFKGVEHRLENYLTIHGVDFINDSKATNINSTWYALESMTKPTVWIVGGVDKGNDYSELKSLVKDKVKAIICLGTENQKIVDYFKDIVPEIVETKSMEHAVKSAYFLSEKGDVVLLSPACASFDLFENYEDRGTQFKKYVKAL